MLESYFISSGVSYLLINLPLEVILAKVSANFYSDFTLIIR